ncbi:MAG: DNA/RNA nuclease SfsA [bacterium]|nr:DNA/RNA nuclease SfsA [bacterium]
MILHEPKVMGCAVTRYKRFLCDVVLDTGEIVTAHMPNSGSMATCIAPGWKVRMAYFPEDSKRKLKYRVDLVHNGDCWICVNTHLANGVVVEALNRGGISELRGFDSLETEKKYGENSRIDILLQYAEKRCYVEVKSVSLLHDGQFMFPDSVSKRGQKHLVELMNMVKAGHRAVLVFVLNRSDGTGFEPARHIDPDYGRLLDDARSIGVEVLILPTIISESEYRIA